METNGLNSPGNSSGYCSGTEEEAAFPLDLLDSSVRTEGLNLYPDSLSACLGPTSGLFLSSLGDTLYSLQVGLPEQTSYDPSASSCSSQSNPEVDRKEDHLGFFGDRNSATDSWLFEVLHGTPSFLSRHALRSDDLESADMEVQPYVHRAHCSAGTDDQDRGVLWNRGRPLLKERSGSVSLSSSEDILTVRGEEIEEAGHEEEEQDQRNFRSSSDDWNYLLSLESWRNSNSDGLPLTGEPLNAVWQNSAPDEKIVVRNVLSDAESNILSDLSIPDIDLDAHDQADEDLFRLIESQNASDLFASVEDGTKPRSFFSPVVSSVASLLPHPPHPPPPSPSSATPPPPHCILTSQPTSCRPSPSSVRSCAWIKQHMSCVTSLRSIEPTQAVRRNRKTLPTNTKPNGGSSSSSGCANPRTSVPGLEDHRYSSLRRNDDSSVTSHSTAKPQKLRSGCSILETMLRTSGRFNPNRGSGAIFPKEAKKRSMRDDTSSGTAAAKQPRQATGQAVQSHGKRSQRSRLLRDLLTCRMEDVQTGSIACGRAKTTKENYGGLGGRNPRVMVNGVIPSSDPAFDCSFLFDDPTPDQELSSRLSSIEPDAVLNQKVAQFETEDETDAWFTSYLRQIS